MALLDIITPETIAERFYTLPQELQNALESGEHRRVIQAICAANGIQDPDDLQHLESIFAIVLLGLAHMDDLKEIILAELDLDPETVDKITAEVRSKVLEPFRKEIEKVYAPAAASEQTEGAVEAAPIAASPTPAPAFTPSPAPTTIKPVPASLPLDSAAPAPMPAPAATTPTPTTPASGPGASSWQPTKLTIPPATPAPAAKPAPAAAPAPFMMREESSASPLAPGADFKLNISKDIFKSAAAKPIDVPRPPKTAELEIGKAPLPPKAGPPSASIRITPPAPSRVVHYTDLRTAMGPFGTPAQPPMNAMPAAAQKPIPQPSPSTAMPSTSPKPNVPLPPQPPKVVNFGPEEVK